MYCATENREGSVLICVGVSGICKESTNSEPSICSMYISIASMKMQRKGMPNVGKEQKHSSIKCTKSSFRIRPSQGCY